MYYFVCVVFNGLVCILCLWLWIALRMFLQRAAGSYLMFSDILLFNWYRLFVFRGAEALLIHIFCHLSAFFIFIQCCMQWVESLWIGLESRRYLGLDLFSVLNDPSQLSYNLFYNNFIRMIVVVLIGKNNESCEQHGYLLGNKLRLNYCYKARISNYQYVLILCQ